MNRFFRRYEEPRYTAETVSKKFEELEAMVEGSWGWWMTAGEGDGEVRDVLRRCGVGLQPVQVAVQDNVQDDAEEDVQENAEEDVQENAEEDAEVESEVDEEGNSFMGDDE